MRRLLRGRFRERDRPGLVATFVAALAIAGTVIVALGARADDRSPSLRITSPLGRTGLPGTIRIVARLDGERIATPLQADFYVDKLYLTSDTDGAPFEAHWNDDNPFERRELMVRAELPSGEVLTDAVVLEPLAVTEAAEVTSVAIEASVVDDKGRFVRDLNAADFELAEGTEPQVIDLVAQERAPALFTLLVDSSQSMAMRATVVRSTARALLDPLHPQDRVVVAPFSQGITSVTGPTLDRATILEAIGAIRPAGGTAILNSLRQATSVIHNEHERHAIVLITDGYDEDSTEDFAATVAALRESDTTLYVIGVGGVAGISLKGEKLLSQLAEQTGGRAWFPRDAHRLAEAYATTAADVQHKYLVTYTPTNQRRDGSWRQVSVKTRTPGVRVRAREGYTAPLAPPIRAYLEFTAVGNREAAATVTRDDVVVVEDGVPQSLDTFHDAVLPVTIMLALDASGSMKRSAEQAQMAAREFVGSMRTEDRLGMIMFGDEARFVHLPTERRDWSLQAIDEYIAAGGTALYDALYNSLSSLTFEAPTGRRVVVVVTDGRDENAASNGPGSVRTWDDVLRKLQQSEATVYAVGLGSRLDKAALQQLADRSGGSAYFPSDVTALAGAYQKILDELRRRYVVGYESTNRIRDGKWRKVEIRVKGQDVTVKSAGGYFAPAQ
jgi:Ca-activated chloride channel family protein